LGAHQGQGRPQGSSSTNKGTCRSSSKEVLTLAMRVERTTLQASQLFIFNKIYHHNVMQCEFFFLIFFIVFQGTPKELRRKFRVQTLETNMTTNLIIFYYQKKLFKIYYHFKSYNIKSSLKLQNLIRHYISIFPLKYKRLLYVKIILSFYPIHSPTLDYHIPVLIRLDFIIIEQYYQIQQRLIYFFRNSVFIAGRP